MRGLQDLFEGGTDGADGVRSKPEDRAEERPWAQKLMAFLFWRVAFRRGGCNRTFHRSAGPKSGRLVKRAAV